MFLTPAANLGDLEERIRNATEGLRQDRQMVRRAVFSMLRRAEVCLERNGGHVEDKHNESKQLLIKSLCLCVNCLLIHVPILAYEIGHAKINYALNQLRIMVNVAILGVSRSF